jgi:hypothetical protein
MRYALFMIAAMAWADTAPITGEIQRAKALQAIFPGMQIALAPDVHIDDSWPEQPNVNGLNAPDAFAREQVYRVTGKPVNPAEREASAQVMTGKASSTRLVRFQLYPWPESTGLLAVVQYKFEDALPSMACPSIGMLVHLENGRVRDRYLLETTHHISLKTVRMLNLNGGTADQLVIESDFGGAEAWGTNFVAFNLNAKFEPIFEITSQISSATDDMFTQSLDVGATVQLRGTQFCFTKTTMIENGIAYAPVRQTRICYKPDDEFVKTEAEERDKLLAPLPKP